MTLTVFSPAQAGGKAPLARPGTVAFGAAAPQPAEPPGDQLEIRQPDAASGATCDLNVRKEKGEFGVTLERYGRVLPEPDQALFAACMHELLYACGLTPDEETDRLATVQRLLRTLDDNFLQRDWIEAYPKPMLLRAAELPLRLFGVKTPKPFTMGDMALNLMVVYGTPADVAYCLEDRKINPNGFSPVSFHREYPTPLFRAVDARKPDNIAVLLKHLDADQLQVINKYRENALQYAHYHQSDEPTLQMLTEAYRKAGR